jgi:hypothetical protein
MKMKNYLSKIMIMLLVLLFAGSTKLFAVGRYNPEGPAGVEGTSPVSIAADNPNNSYDEVNSIFSRYSKGEEIVTSVDEIEMPLRQTDYGKYYDDFNRRVSNEIRSEAKKLFIEQEKAKELTNLEDAVMPLVKKGGITKDDYYYNYSYNYYVWPEYEANSALNKYPVAFYDSLGRKISDDLIEEAAKLYEKQKRHRELTDWSSTSVSSIWCYIWGTVKFIITLMILFFIAALFYKKVIKKA